MSSSTIADAIRRGASEHPSAPAILAPGRPPLAWGDLGTLLASAGEGLRERGIVAGSRVALALPNGPEHAAAVLATMRFACCAPLNPRYRQSEFEFYLADLGADALVVPDGGAPEADAAAAALGVPLLRLRPESAGPAGVFTLAGDAARAPVPGRTPAALLLHTSGTTSRPKLVPLSAANLAASADNIARTLALSPADRCLNIMPLFHIHGIVAALLSTLVSGGSVVCTDGVYGAAFLEWLGEFQPTWYTAVPTMHQAIAARAAERAPLHTSLRFIRSSSASLAPAVLEQLEAVFRVPVVEAYGMTEAAHQMASNPLPPGERRPGSVGPAAGPDIAIMDAAGTLLPVDCEGEVVIRGENVTAGYENNPEANASAYTAGWFRTGDLGVIDASGYLTLRGRIKEQINRGGEKISPREIDEVLLRHPAIAQAVAFGVPHRQLGEEVAAAVVLKPGAALEAGELRSFAAASLAPFKVPRLVRFLDEVPKGPTGKLQRIGLAALLGIDPLDDNAAADFVAPRTAAEERIAAVWRTVLRCERVGARDRFSALGGDSLLAAGMLETVAAELGTDSDFEQFFAEGTVEAIAADLQRGRPGALIALTRAAGQGAAVFAPGHDNVFVGLRAMAPAVPGLARSFALDYNRYAGEAHDPAALARAALKDVTSVDGLGLIGGVCFGGFVALELARLIEREHGRVMPVALIDSVNPAWAAHADAGAYTAAVARQMRAKTPWHVRTVAELGPVRAGSYIAGRIRAFARYHSEGRSPSTSTREVLRRASRQYRPEGIWDGPVLLVRTAGRRIDAPAGGWSGVLNNLEEHVVAFHPGGALSEERAAHTAALLAQFVNTEVAARAGAR